MEDETDGWQIPEMPPTPAEAESAREHQVPRKRRKIQMQVAPDTDMSQQVSVTSRTREVRDIQASGVTGHW